MRRDAIFICELATATVAPPRQHPPFATTDDTVDLHVDVPISSGLLARDTKRFTPD
jgi:hypothetical protein